MPMTPFMGVRISWLMLARNSLFDLGGALRLAEGFLRAGFLGFEFARAGFKFLAAFEQAQS